MAVGLQRVGRASYAICLVHLHVLLGLLALGTTPVTLGRAGFFVLTAVPATLAGLVLTAFTAPVGRPAPRQRSSPVSLSRRSCASSYTVATL